jgi:phage gp29-like protein
MSKPVLGGTETVQASSASGYGQAKVHDVLRKDIRESRSRFIGADLTRDLVTPMTELNFSGCIPARFEFITQDPVDLKNFSEGIANLAKVQVQIPAKWVRDQAGIPDPKNDEDTIGGMPEPDPDIPIDVGPEEDADGNPVGDAEPKPKPNG